MYNFEFKHPTIDWSKVPVGSDVSACINGVDIINSKIQKDEDGEIFICHNSTSKNINHDPCKDKLGFKYALSLGYNGENVDQYNDGEIIILSIDEDSDFVNQNIFLEVDGEKTKVKFENGKIKVGCCTITNEVVERIFDNLQY